MKSKSFLIVISLLFLVLSASASVLYWAEVASAVKIGMFAFGFGSGVAAGGYFAMNRK